MFVKSIFVPVNVPCAGNTRMTGPLVCQGAVNPGGRGDTDRNRTFQSSLISAMHRVWQAVSAEALVTSSFCN